MPTKELIVKATGEDESRELHLSRNDQGQPQIVIWWGKGDRALATLKFDDAEWAKLAGYAEELKK